jgi:hypothetical protein
MNAFLPQHRIDCSWCQCVMSDGVEPISHGVCPACLEKLNTELDVVEAARAIRFAALEVEKRIEEAARARRAA